MNVQREGGVGEGPEQPPPKRKRGPYKRYLFQDLSVPSNTLSYRSAQGQLQHGNDGQDRDGILQGNMDQNIAAEPIEDHNNINQNENPDGILQGNMDQNFAAEPIEDHNNINQNENRDADQNLIPDETAEGDANIAAYIEKHKLLQKLHKDFHNSKLDVLIMIFNLAIRHCYTQHFIEDQIKFVNALFGGNNLDVSWHVVKTLFAPTVPITRHYFCPDCDVYVGCNFPVDQKFAACPQCNKNLKIKSIDSGNFFVTLSLNCQIEELLKKPGLKIMFGNKRSEDNEISDLFDGNNYRRCSTPGGPLDDARNALTLSVNTDGATKFNKTHNTLWPILAYINEISPEQRFKPSNIIVGGLWFGKQAPNMSLYLKPFQEEVNRLHDGVRYCKPDGGVIQCPVYCHNWTMDLPARAKVCCQRQFNGGFGCLYCYHPNNSTVGDDNKNKYYDTSVSYPTRTHEEIVSDMLKADDLVRKKQLPKTASVRGFLGISSLLEMTKVLDYFPTCPFNLPWGVTIDYLHAVLEGVAVNLFDIYESLLTPAQWCMFDKRLKAIKPPQAMTHRPREIEARVHFRGKEYRALLLYYALPCLEDLLPPRNFENLKLLVNALHILLSEKITPRDLEDGINAMNRFVVGYQRLYGLEKVTSNLHLCSHLFQLLQEQGPVWCYAMLFFESGNGLLLKLIRGTRCVVNELSIKFTALLTASKIIEKNPISDCAVSFCNDLLGCSYIKNSKEFGNVCVLGLKSTAVIDEEEVEILSQHNVSVVDMKVRFFNRAVQNGIVFCSKSYTKTNCFDDSCVMLFDDSYAVIDKLVESATGELLCLIKPIHISHDLILSVKRCAYHPYGALRVIPFSSIKRKSVMVSFEDKSFVCVVPNFYERD